MTMQQYEITAVIVIVFLTLISFLFKEASERLSDKILNAYITGNQSKLSHQMGLFLRIGLFFILGLDAKHTEVMLILLLLYVIIAWPMFNITINIFRKMKWYYVGTGGIDGLIRKVLFFINFDK